MNTNPKPETNIFHINKALSHLSFSLGLLFKKIRNNERGQWKSFKKNFVQDIVD